MKPKSLIALSFLSICLPTYGQTIVNSDGFSTDGVLPGGSLSSSIGPVNTITVADWGNGSGGNLAQGAYNFVTDSSFSSALGISNSLTNQEGSLAFGFANEIQSTSSFGQANIAMGYSNVIGNNTLIPQWGNLLLGAENSSFTNNAWILGLGNIGQEGTVTLGRFAATVPNATLIVGNGTAPNSRSNGLVVLNSGAVQVPGNLTLSQTSGITFGNGSTPSISGSTNGTIIFNNPVNLTTGLQISGGALTVNSTTDSTSSSTGALTIAGGIGIGKDAFINGIRVGRGPLNHVTNTVIGLGGFISNVSGAANTAVGQSALRNSLSGDHNSAFGSDSLRGNTQGNHNTAIGSQALISNTTGSSNSSLGVHSLSANTQGSFNTSIGNNSGFNNSTGNHNVFIGNAAGRFQANGTTALTHPDNSIYIGSGALGKDNSDSNSIVIGHNAVGEGANTTVIGSTLTQRTKLFGLVQATNGVIAPWYGGSNGNFYGGDFQGGDATKYNQIAIGYGTETANDSSIAIGGFYSDGLNDHHSIIGLPGNYSSGKCSSAFGGRANAALGLCSYSMGNETIASSAFSVAMGSRNLSSANYSTQDDLNWIEDSPLFELGNGDPALEPWLATEYSNALTTLKNGQTTLTNKAWKNRDAQLVTATEDPSAANTDSEGNALVVEGHTVLKGKVVIEQPQGDISMGAYQ
jgi:hypothetical protein